MNQKDGPGAPGGQSWTVKWLKFDNSYFKDIKETRDEDLLVLPTDAVIFEDPSFKVYAEKYTEDQDAFFKDYAEAHAQLSNLGAKFDPPEPQTPSPARPCAYQCHCSPLHTSPPSHACPVHLACVVPPSRHAPALPPLSDVERRLHSRSDPTVNPVNLKP
ncbi:putative L-ascorbate peroxidase 7, chloroplastic [Sarracenia purpurea var. burkii]